jgi:UDPglucose 6-dehydrogenase
MNSSNKKICVIGTGYVGLVSGACFAKMGHSVICVDNNESKIKLLEKGISPIYEPGIEKLILENKKAGRLFFTTDINKAVKKSDIIFIAVHTPTKENGETDLQFVEKVAQEVAKAMNKYKVVVSKSTMPVRTGQKIKETLKKFVIKNIEFDVTSNPEFLREGSAIKDFLEPDRVVIGVETKKAKKIMADIYKSIGKEKIIFTDIESSEVIKHACNAFLATKISFINAISNICQRNGADVEQVALAMGLDKRIGKDFLKAGIGFGGSCFPKDVSAFINVAEKCGYDFSLLKEVKKINKKQKEIFLETILKNLPKKEKIQVGIWGLSFKPDTDDMREAPSIDIINGLLKKQIFVKAYDPVAIKKSKEIFKDKIIYCDSAKEVLENCDALIILTEWNCFKKFRPEEIKKINKNIKIFDGRNIFDPAKMKKMGVNYYSIGRK